MKKKVNESQIMETKLQMDVDFLNQKDAFHTANEIQHQT